MEDQLNSYTEETLRILDKTGCLLVSGSLEKANVMTIGWGLIGPLWGKPFFIVAVRPSRYTFKFIEKSNDFTVNVPKKGMEKIVDFCGSVSGREYDKFEEQKLTLAPSKMIHSPIITDCILHYECEVSYKTKIPPNKLPKKIQLRNYPKGDYHTLYFGEILATYTNNSSKDNLLV